MRGESQAEHGLDGATLERDLVPLAFHIAVAHDASAGAEVDLAARPLDVADGHQIQSLVIYVDAKRRAESLALTNTTLVAEPLRTGLTRKRTERRRGVKRVDQLLVV